MIELAKTGAELPDQAGRAFLVLAILVAVILGLERLPLDWYGMGPHHRPPRLARWRRQRQVIEAAAVPQDLRPPGPITPPKVIDGNGHLPGSLAPPPQQVEGHFSAEYLAYLQGRLPSPIDGKRWPDRIKPWKDAHRARQGVCDIGRVLARGGQPSCGSREPLRRMDTDHLNYDHLFCERRQDVVFGCRPCHTRRTNLSKAGLDIYQAWGLP